MSDEHAGFLAQIGPYLAALVAYAGWRVTYANAKRIEARKAKLARVDEQLQKLYGPLAALIQTRTAALNKFLALHRGGARHFFDGEKLTPEQMRQWRLWRIEVMMPLVTQMQEAMLGNYHLFEGGLLKPAIREVQNDKGEWVWERPAVGPTSFQLLMQHVSAYRAVVANWAYVIEENKRAGADAPNIDAQQYVVREGDDQPGWWPVVPHEGSLNFPRRELWEDIEPTLKDLLERQHKLRDDAQMES